MLSFKRIILPIFLASILLLQTATFGTAYSEPTISEQIKDPLVYQETESKLASDLWTKIFLLNSNVNPGDNFAYNIEFGNYGPADATDVNYSFSILQEGVSITNVVTEGLCEWDSNNVYCYSEYVPSGSSTFAQIVLNVSEDASPALLMPTSDITAPVFDNVSTNNKSEINGPAIIIPPSNIDIESTDEAVADLDISIIPVSEDLISKGFLVGYSVYISNDGPNDAQNVIAKIIFDNNAYDALIFDEPIPECQVSGTTMECSYQTIPNGGLIILLFDVEYHDSEDYDGAMILGEIQSSTVDPNFENNVDSELFVFEDATSLDLRTDPVSEPETQTQIDPPSLQLDAGPADTTIQKIPEWIKSNAGWWADDKIDDQSFVNGIGYLIREGIIVIDEIPPSSEIRDENIPSWIKNNAGWWAAGLITEADFLSGLEYMVSYGIISNSILADLGGIGGALGRALGLKNADLKTKITSSEITPMTGDYTEPYWDDDPDFHLTTAYGYAYVEVTVKNLGPDTANSSTLIVKIDDFKHVVYGSKDGDCSLVEETIICHYKKILKEQTKTMSFTGYAELSQADLHRMRINPEEHSPMIRIFSIIAIVSSPDDKLTPHNDVDIFSKSLKFENHKFVRDSNSNGNDVKELDSRLVWIADPYVDLPDFVPGTLKNPKKGDQFELKLIYGNNATNPSFANHLSIYVIGEIDIEKWAKTQQKCSFSNISKIGRAVVECDISMLAPYEKITKIISVEITEDPWKFSSYALYAVITSLTPDKEPDNNLDSSLGPEMIFDGGE